jgi:hypothetical protein
MPSPSTQASQVHITTSRLCGHVVQCFERDLSAFGAVTLLFCCCALVFDFVRVIAALCTCVCNLTSSLTLILDCDHLM